MKDSFILFTEYKEQFEMLTNEQAGVLIRAIFSFVSDEEVPEMEPLTRMAFTFIKAAIDRADDKYQRKVNANRVNGCLGGRPRSTEKPKQETQENPTETQKPNGFNAETQEKPKNPPDNEPDNVRDNDNVRGRNNAHTREATAMERFLKRWGVNSNAIGNYSGGRLSGIDWDRLSEKMERSTLLRQKKAISFFIKHYDDILDGNFDDTGQKFGNMNEARLAEERAARGREWDRMEQEGKV